MKFELVTTKLGGTSWAIPAIEVYEKKISHFYPMAVTGIKVPKVDRRNRDIHKRVSSEKIRSSIEPKSRLISFDERGKKLSSEEFSKVLEKHLESGRSKIQFFVGGPYGLSREIIEASDSVISLSPLVLCQEVAMIVALEQIYRGLTIINNIPYHNR